MPGCLHPALSCRATRSSPQGRAQQSLQGGGWRAASDGYVTAVQQGAKGSLLQQSNGGRQRCRVYGLACLCEEEGSFPPAHNAMVRTQSPLAKQGATVAGAGGGGGSGWDAPSSAYSWSSTHALVALSSPMLPAAPDGAQPSYVWTPGAILRAMEASASYSLLLFVTTKQEDLADHKAEAVPPAK